MALLYVTTCEELCTASFEQACRQQEARDMIIHSDRGSQYTSYKFRETLSKCGAVADGDGQKYRIFVGFSPTTTENEVIAPTTVVILRLFIGKDTSTAVD